MKHIISVGLISIGLFCLTGMWTNRQLEVEKRKLVIDNLPESLTGVTLVHLSDIHLKRLKVKRKKLIKQIKKEQPDLIVLTGDSIDRTEQLAESQIQALINTFADIAPTYIVEGNHEPTNPDYQAWRKLILDSKGVLLENEIATIILNDTPLSLVGLKNNQTDLPTATKSALANTSVNFILAHHPELFTSYLESFKDYPIQAIFSGHAHGGQIRLPFLGGLLSPNQGFLPTLTSGSYTDPHYPESTLYVSRGLANSSFPLRLNNKPHIISLTLDGTR